MMACIAEIAVREQQGLGYWGCGDAVAAAQLLRALTGKDWQYRSEISLTLAASGLTNCNKDAWAREVGEGFILGRDRFGRVPLYWLQREELIWFSTQLQALLPLVEKNIDLAALYAYSCFSYVPAPLTPIINIYALEAGTELCWSLEAGDKISAPLLRVLADDWRENPEEIATEEEAIPQLQGLLTRATERQIGDIGGETVGVFLSGGLDSSIVAALLVRAGIKVRAYSLDLGDYSPSELPYAERVADWLKIPLVKVAATSKAIYPAILPAIRALDLPFGDGVTIPLYLLNRAAREEVGIIFNGEGGDQLFAGWTNKPLIAASLYQSQHPEGEDWLPPGIVWRQKRGMGVPLTPWFLQHWWRDLGQWLNPATLEVQGHWQRDLPLRVATGNLSGFIQGRRIGETLWLLVAWQLWRQQMLEEEPRSSLRHPFWLPHSFWRLKKQWT